MTVLAHERFGHGPERVIVLHEFYGGIRSWDPLRPYLDTQRFQYAFADLRGYGQSIRMSGEFSAAEIADDVSRLADALGADRYHLVGHSMTGLAIQHAVLADARGAKRIKRAVAVTPAPTNGFEHNEDALNFFRATLTDDELLGRGFAMLTGGRWGEGFIRYKTQLNRSSSRPEVMARYMDNVVFLRGLTEEAASAAIETPLLVIAGAHDAPTMHLAALMASMNGAFPRAEWLELPEAGHYPMDECPVALATAIEQFLRGESSESPGAH